MIFITLDDIIINSELTVGRLGRIVSIIGTTYNS